ncbi:MAG: S9 family peptidase [Candidatus Korobacteraceae bacterium]
MTATNFPDTTILRPPVAKQVPHEYEMHGSTFSDPYAWLKEKSNPEVAAYLEAENAYADAVMKPTEDLQETLYQEMLSHIQQTDVAVPYRFGEHFYYSRTEEGKQYPIFCRKQGSLEAPEQVILDLNELAVGEQFMAVGVMAVSDDGNLLAYSTDNVGFRQYTLRVKDLRTGQLFPERIEKTGSVAWAADNRTLFYTIEDHAKRQYRLYRHELGSIAPDALIYEETDERFNIGVERTRSREYLLLSIGSHTTSEWRYMEAANPVGEWQTISPRVQDHEYDVDHHEGRFLIRTNDRGRNFRLVSAPVSDPDRQNWQELVAHRSDVMLAAVDVFRTFYVCFERENGLPHLTLTRFGSGDTHRIGFPEPVYSVAPAQNREYETALYRYSYQSLVTPNSVFDYDAQKRKSTLLKQQEVPGYDSSQYQSERLWAAASDGRQIPISVVYRKGFQQNGRQPLLLNAYGSYGASIPTSFNSNWLALLDRGFAVAIAHIRGGGDMGKTWHDQGRMLQKKTTFTDFTACAEFLISQKYTSPDRLAIQGGSAGGLLMGAVVNMRPELFRAVISKVPFVDVINTMLDPTLPLTIPEYEEWGNPSIRAEYDYIRSYSPYDNLRAQAYPAMLIKTSFHDSQVMYHEPAKYVAKLRTLKTDTNALLLKTNMAAGHGGASGRYDYLREIAFDYAFLLWQVEEPS